MKFKRIKSSLTNELHTILKLSIRKFTIKLICELLSNLFENL